MERPRNAASAPTSPSASAACIGTPTASSNATSCSTRPCSYTRPGGIAGSAPSAERGPLSDGVLLPGRPMALDHRRILATALGRLRGKIRYRPVVFELLPPTFTLLLLQKVVEALTGFPLHKQNFRRLVEHGGLVEGTGQDVQTGGRPAELFRFRREVLRERPAPGVGLPGVRR